MTDMFSTYQAAELAKNYKATGKPPVRKNSDGNMAPLSSFNHNRPDYSSESEVDADELSRISKPVVKQKKGKKKSDLRDRIEKKRSKRKRKADASSDESGDDNISQNELADLRADIAEPVSRGSRSSRLQWTEYEDAVLRRLYRLYAGSHSVFTMIAQDSSLVELGGKKNAQKVERRVQQLGLHLELASMLASDEEEGEHSLSDSSESISDNHGDRLEHSGSGAKKHKKRKRKSIKEMSKKQKSGIFIDSGNIRSDTVVDDDSSVKSLTNDPDSDGSDNHSKDDNIEEPITTSWTLSSPSEIYSEEVSSTDKPFWEEDLEDMDENSFDKRMRALASRNVNSETNVSQSDISSSKLVQKKKSLLKNRNNSNLTHDSDSDLGDDEINTTEVDVGTNAMKGTRSSILIDSDDDN